MKGSHRKQQLKISDLFLLLSSALCARAERGCDDAAFVASLVLCLLSSRVFIPYVSLGWFCGRSGLPPGSEGTSEE